MASPTERGWLGPALWIVGLVTALRWLLLAFDNTDLYVDEAQYWLWGQEFAFGYYSKPPLIAWLIGGVTFLAGSDSVFWVRMPGAALHGATALILAAWATRLLGPRQAILTAAAYATLPMTALGSLLITTDTVMAPFFAAALFFHHRLCDTRARRFALLAGAAIGLAFMAKYVAALYLLCAALAATFQPRARIGWANAALMLAAFALVISPNLIWNATHQLTTFAHTADNIGWVQSDHPLAGLSLFRVVEFLVSQFAVAGPLIFAAILWGLARPNPARRLWAFVVPPLAVVTTQALLGEAQANWAISAYFAGTILAVAVLADKPRWLAASFIVNGTICLIMPLLVIFTDISLDGKIKLLDRQLGRADFSRQIIAISEQHGQLPIYSERRDILADLFYSGRDAHLTLYAPHRDGRPSNHYEQRYPLPPGLTGQIVVIANQPPICPTAPTAIPLDPQGGAYSKWGLAAYVVGVECLYAQ